MADQDLPLQGEWEDDTESTEDEEYEITIKALDDLEEPIRKRLEEEGTFDGVDLTKGIKPMFGSPGGKKKLAKKIVEMFPDHTNYVEPFIGGGAVFFSKGKDPTKGKEYIGDLDPEIANAYLFMQKATDDQIAAAQKKPWICNRKIHADLRAKKDIPTDPIDRFHKFLYMTKASMFNRRGGSYSVGDEGKDFGKAVARIPQVRDRLKDVVIKSGDYVATVAAGDDPEALIYLDPPYEGTATGLTEVWNRTNTLTTDSFLAAIKKFKGRIVASHIGKPEVIKRFKAAGLKVHIVEIARQVGNIHVSNKGGVGVHLAKEIIATNFDRCGKRLVKECDSPFDFKEGDSGIAILQTHERGLRETTVQDFPGMHLGTDPVEVGQGSIDRLVKVLDADWKSAVKDATDRHDGSFLRKIVDEAIVKPDLEKIDKRALALIDPVSIHTDLRLWKTGPTPADFWEGGEILTPGNQFCENGLIADPAVAIPMNFKKAQEDGSAVVKGSLDWIDVGKSAPACFPPGRVGDWEGWSRFKQIEKCLWIAGTQAPDRKEFWFDGKILRGRYLIEKSGEDWTIVRPEVQDMESAIFEKGKVLKQIAVPIVKAESKGEKRIALGPVLIPDVVDAQGDKISAESIELAAHDFLERYNQTSQAGVMHRYFDKDVRIVESYIAPQDLKFGERTIPKGTWMMAVHVIDTGTWDRIRSGEIVGFSIGGVAQEAQAVEDQQ